ncbi:MAG: glycosyltransferase family 39 protein, partial [Myxococcota bacterium]|nr:glycosyltransferase family 39 protein [Myxococcota bacterium]
MSAKTLDDEISQPAEEPSIEASKPDEDADLDLDQASEEPIAKTASTPTPEAEDEEGPQEQDTPAPEECNPERDEDPSQESSSAPPIEPPPRVAPLTRIGQLVAFHAQSKSVWRDRGIVALLSALVYLPLLGSFGLWDPWETHYGEVGRQITERNDWISTWWGSKWQDAGGAREGSYFFSKPILLMWLMAMGMRVFGVNEIGIRIGVCLVAMLGLVVVFSMGREVFSRRAGFLMAGVLGTAPFYSMLGRQAQTDMPFVGLMLVGMCFFMMAAFGKHREQPADRVGYGLTLGWLGLVSIPQLSLLVVGLARWRGGQNSIMTPLAQQPLTVISIGSGLMLLAGVALAAGIFFKRGRAPGKDPDAPNILASLSLHRWFAIAMAILWVPLLGLLVGALAGGKPLLALNGWFVWGPVQAALYASCLLFAVYWMFAR